jgi:hypothetical protein
MLSVRYEAAMVELKTVKVDLKAVNLPPPRPKKWLANCKGSWRST